MRKEVLEKKANELIQKLNIKGEIRVFALTDRIKYYGLFFYDKITEEGLVVNLKGKKAKWWEWDCDSWYNCDKIEVKWGNGKTRKYKLKYICFIEKKIAG